MTTQRNFMCGILILAIGVLKENIVFVRSVCLQDALTFYNSKKDACSFRKDDFNRIFLNNSKECQINCSINSSKPQYSNLGDKKYEVINMEIRFTSTSYKFPLKTLCSNGTIENFDIDLDCEGEYLHDRGIGESCVNDNQCGNVNVNSTCDETTQLCQCKSGHLYLWENKTCSPVQELGEMCYDSRQCKWMNPFSICNNEHKCECQRGYIKLNNLCMPERRLNETCEDDLQCSMVTPNSTCNRTTKLCTCNEGILPMMNMCVHGRLVEEILNHCKRVQLSIERVADNNVEQICSMHSETFLSTSTSKEADNDSSYGLVVGVGIAGLVIGIAICGAVYVIMTRHRTTSQNRTNAVKEEINQPGSVEVSNAVYSEPIKHKNKKCNTGIAGENAIYNHLHEDPSEVCIQADYDHVPQLGTEDDDYSHLATCNATDVNGPEEYGVVN
nr:prion-like-(Q/N-rich) domain-bearing protein 25 isoform X2 [Crassostrea gigas]